MRPYITHTTFGEYIYHMLCDQGSKRSKEKAVLLMTSEFVLHASVELAADRNYSNSNAFRLECVP